MGKWSKVFKLAVDGAKALPKVAVFVSTTVDALKDIKKTADENPEMVDIAKKTIGKAGDAATDIGATAAQKAAEAVETAKGAVDKAVDKVKGTEPPAAEEKPAPKKRTRKKPDGPQ
jgi:methyl-accepting chemotaxis protein